MHLGFDLALADARLQPLVLIFHIAASPMLDACLSSSISSRVLTTRARDTAGQPLTMFRPSLLKRLECRHVEVVDADLLLLDLVLLRALP